MELEFDPVKSEANLAKHGLDFTAAQALRLGPIVEAPALTTDEPRTIGAHLGTVVLECARLGHRNIGSPRGMEET